MLFKRHKIYGFILGRISSYYYLSHLTLRMYKCRLHGELSIDELLLVLTGGWRVLIAPPSVDSLGSPWCDCKCCFLSQNENFSFLVLHSQMPTSTRNFRYDTTRIKWTRSSLTTSPWSQQVHFWQSAYQSSSSIASSLLPYCSPHRRWVKSSEFFKPVPLSLLSNPSVVNFSLLYCTGILLIVML